MSVEIAACNSAEELLQSLVPVLHYFGAVFTPQDANRFVPFVEPSGAFAARVDGVLVGGAASFPFELTVPGDVVRAAAPAVAVKPAFLSLAPTPHELPGENAGGGLMNGSGPGQAATAAPDPLDAERADDHSEHHRRECRAVVFACGAPGQVPGAGAHGLLH